MKVPSWVDLTGLWEHVIVGFWLTVLTIPGPAWLGLWTAIVLGLVHEWMDGDLLIAPGHPWNGLLDIFAFCVIPILRLM